MKDKQVEAQVEAQVEGECNTGEFSTGVFICYMSRRTIIVLQNYLWADGGSHQSIHLYRRLSRLWMCRLVTSSLGTLLFYFVGCALHYNLSLLNTIQEPVDISKNIYNPLEGQ